jgi:hypothetical protein
VTHLGPACLPAVSPPRAAGFPDGNQLVVPCRACVPRLAALDFGEYLLFPPPTMRCDSLVGWVHKGFSRYQELIPVFRIGLFFSSVHTQALHPCQGIIGSGSSVPLTTPLTQFLHVRTALSFPPEPTIFPSAAQSTA